MIEEAATFDSQIGDIGRPITTVRVAFAVRVGIVCERLSAVVRVREGDVVVAGVLAFNPSAQWVIWHAGAEINSKLINRSPAA